MPWQQLQWFAQHRHSSLFFSRKLFIIYNKFGHVLKTDYIWFPRSFTEHNMLSILNFYLSFKPPLCINVVLLSHKLLSFHCSFQTFSLCFWFKQFANNILILLLFITYRPSNYGCITTAVQLWLHNCSFNLY